MNDILDILDELDDENLDFDDEDTPLDGNILDPDDGLELDTVEDMTESEAREITEAIRATAAAIHILLAHAHDKKAHKALGYETWADYVKQEFEISPQRSYQLIDLSRAISMIEDAAPDGTRVKLTEAEARDIKQQLPAITEQVRHETRDKTPEEAAADIDRIIEETREQKKEDTKAVEEKQKALDAAELDERNKSLEDDADSLLEADRSDGVTSNADDGFVELDIAGDGDEPNSEDSLNIYNFFNALNNILTLPEPEEFIDIIPKTRRGEMEVQLLQVTSWVNRMQTLFELQED